MKIDIGQKKQTGRWSTILEVRNFFLLGKIRIIYGLGVSHCRTTRLAHTPITHIAATTQWHRQYTRGIVYIRQRVAKGLEVFSECRILVSDILLQKIEMLYDCQVFSECRILVSDILLQKIAMLYDCQINR